VDLHHIAEVMARRDIVIDCAIVPIRKLSDAAESRRSVQRLRGTFFKLVYELKKPKQCPIIICISPALFTTMAIFTK
jgi:hypothetical protein